MDDDDDNKHRTHNNNNKRQQSNNKQWNLHSANYIIYWHKHAMMIFWVRWAVLCAMIEVRIALWLLAKANIDLVLSEWSCATSIEFFRLCVSILDIWDKSTVRKRNSHSRFGVSSLRMKFFDFARFFVHLVIASIYRVQIVGIRSTFVAFYRTVINVNSFLTIIVAVMKAIKNKQSECSPFYRPIKFFMEFYFIACINCCNFHKKFHSTKE